MVSVGFIFGCSVLATKKNMYVFYASPSSQHHQHRFQHPPHVQPTSQPTSQHHQQIEGLGFLHLQHHQFLCGKASWPFCEDSNTGKLIPVKHLKRSGGVGGGGSPPPMMIEKVMIQLGMLFNLCDDSIKGAGRLGGGSSPPMMIKKVMIQCWAKKSKK